MAVAPLTLLSAALLASPAAVRASRLPAERPQREAAWSSCGDATACASLAPQPTPECESIYLLQRSASLMRGGRVLRSIGGRDLAGLLTAEPDDDSDLAALLDLPAEDTLPEPVPVVAAALGAGAVEQAASVPSNASSEMPEPAAPDAGSSSSWWPALGFVKLGEALEAGAEAVEQKVSETASMAHPMIPAFAASTMQTTTTTTTAAGSLTYNASSTNTVFNNLTHLFAPGNSSAWELLGRSLPASALMMGKAQAAPAGLTTEAVVSTLASRTAGLSRMAAPLPSSHWASFEDAFGTANVSEEQALRAAADLALLWNTDMASAARRDANTTKSSAVPADLLDECEAGLAALAKISGGALPPPADGFDASALQWRGFCAQLAQRLAAAFDEADSRAAKRSEESSAQGRRQALASEEAKE